MRRPLLAPVLGTLLIATVALALFYAFVMSDPGPGPAPAPRIAAQCSDVPGNIDYIGFTTLGQLTAQSTLVVRAQVERQTRRPVPSGGISTAGYRVRVERLIAGHGIGAGGRLDIVLPATPGQALPLPWWDHSLFIPGTHEILFLWRDHRGHYGVVGGPQGRFYLRKNKTILPVSCEWQRLGRYTGTPVNQFIRAIPVAAVASGLPASALPWCTSADLHASANWQGVNTTRIGGITFTARPGAVCRLRGRPRITLTEAGHTLKIRQRPGIDIASFGEGTERTVVVRPGRSVGVVFDWANWCGSQSSRTPTVLSVTLLRTGSRLRTYVRYGRIQHSSTRPYCLNPSAPSTLAVGVIRPVTSEHPLP